MAACTRSGRSTGTIEMASSPVTRRTFGALRDSASKVACSSCDWASLAM
jgi:hypothetical protein